MFEPGAVHRCDVLVIGAGGAGLRAALAAADEGASVIVVSKSLLGKSQTVMGAALAASLGADKGKDSWQAHFDDTIDGGRYVNDPSMVELLAREAPERVREMQAWGAVFGRAADGTVRLSEASGHRNSRLVRAGQHNTGLELLRTLQAQVNARSVRFFGEHTIAEILKDDQGIAGALAYERESGDAIVFVAPAIVLATGGAGKAYAFTSNFYDSTGDGQALALRAGAELVDMEFVQFHPTGMVAPESARGLLVAESIRNFGGVMRNTRGERFMFAYAHERYPGRYAETEAEAEGWYSNPSGVRAPPELVPRDDLSKGIEREIRAGRGTERGGVLLDIASRRDADYIKRALPHMYRQFKHLADVDITAQPMEVAPTAHYLMGGIRVEADTARSRVEGLFAAGEAAGGVHGANRLNGNGISELLVFGRRAGMYSARYAKARATRTDPQTSAIESADRAARAPVERASGENPYLLLRELQALMQKEAGLVRSAESLTRAADAIRRLRERALLASAPGGRAANSGWQCAFDVRSLLSVTEAIVFSAVAREESRGAHVRDDYPDADDGLKSINIVVRKRGEALEVRKEQARASRSMRRAANEMETTETGSTS